MPEMKNETARAPDDKESESVAVAVPDTDFRNCILVAAPGLLRRVTDSGSGIPNGGDTRMEHGDGAHVT